jgi:hypothetical protein
MASGFVLGGVVMDTVTEGELTIPLPPTAQPTVSAILSRTTAHKTFRIIF